MQASATGDRRLATPPRTVAQRRTALARANVVRVHHAQVKRDLKAGRKGMFDVIEDGRCATMKIVDVLLAMPKVGRVKANKALSTVRISPSRSCGGLTERQKLDLAAHMGAPSGRPLLLRAPVGS